MSRPTVSILAAVHRQETADFLAACLDSLAAQSLRAEEVVLVEDGPIGSELSDIIESFRQKLNIVSVKLEQNQGLGAALHAGLAQCRGELVARMDTDDIALPERLLLQYGAFQENPSLDIVGGYAMEIDAHGARGRVRIVPTDHDSIIRALWANPVIHPAVMFRREKVLAVGSYAPELRRRQDYELWFRCAANGLRFANLAVPLIEYRFTPETLRRQSSWQMLQHGMIGFRGSRAVGLPLWAQIACFAPFLRSLLPSRLEHLAYRLSQQVGPKKVGRGSL